MSENTIFFPRESIWSEKKIDIAWAIVSNSRGDLMLTISPTISSSFIFLHYYFQKYDKTPHKLYLLLVSSLFLACKVDDFYRPLEIIFREFAKSAMKFQACVQRSNLNEALGERDFKNDKLTDFEISQVSNIEIDILNCIGWNLSIDLPFIYININKKYVEEAIDHETYERLTAIVVRNICIVIKSIKYLTYDVEQTAAVAVTYAFEFLSCDYPAEIKEWIDRMENKDKESFSLIYELICNENKKCLRLYN